MKRCFVLLSTVLLTLTATGQSVSQRVATAYESFEKDSQLRSAISSLYVVDAKSGAVVFEKNERIGLATASTLKVITAASAYELLGKEFRYKTSFGYIGKIQGGRLLGDFLIQASGDPTFGSWRWKATRDTEILTEIGAAVKGLKISGYNGFVTNKKGWDSEAIPDGWMWQDIGNYYGAGADGFNWHENQFDIHLKSGASIGEPVTVAQTKPRLYGRTLRSLATTAAKGTGDNSYVYFPFSENGGVIRGTIPAGENAFVISAATPNPEQEFINRLRFEVMPANNIGSFKYEGPRKDTTLIWSHYSPPLDSINYYFLKRSINLYGEALIKTIAYQRKGFASTDGGTEIVRSFWKEKGIDPVELKLEDGSGLSPLNRVTTHAQVQVLQYAQKQSWFSGFLHGFPEYNGMKLKSGTISGVKGFCGYHTAKDGKQYIVSFLVNNYNGSASRLVQKMYKVLDELK